MRLEWAKEWMTTEFNVSTLPLEDQMGEMQFFIKKAAPYRGMEIKVVSEDIATHRYERDVIAAAFRNITGINLKHVILDESRVVETLSKQVRTGQNLYDAYVSDSDLIGTHWRSCGVTAISEWVLGDGANVTLPSLDIHDFIGLDFVTTPDGKIYQLPDQQFANLYWFRYDLFTDPQLQAQFRQLYGYELGVPLDWSAYEQIADFFTNEVREMDGKPIYGHMDYGKNDASLGWRFHDAWLSMAGAGDKGEPNGLPVDEWGIRVVKCRPVGASVERGGAVNSPASIYAATKYIDWQLRYAPSGTLDLNFSTSGSWPAGGQIAQQIFWYTTFTADLLKAPAITHPDGRPKWRMAPSPHGPYWEQGMKVGYQDVGSWTLLESTPLERRQAAWLYAQFTVSKSISLRKTLVGLTPIRESDLWSQALSDMAPKLGGLVEFYRSPDRSRWSPTGTNVPDYPRLAPLWWKNIGAATLLAAAGGNPRTEATKAMDQLAHDMDAMLYRIGQDSNHPCAPQLNPRRPQLDWLREAGAPKALQDEQPPGMTISYDSLVQAWREGMSINYDFGLGVLSQRQACAKDSGNHPADPAHQDPCPGGFLLGSICVDECPPSHDANVTSGTCGPRNPVTHRIVNFVDLTLSWGVNEVAFFTDTECRQALGRQWPPVSSGDMDDHSRSNAFDGILESAWIATCASCPNGTAFIGQQHPADTTVRCLKIFQSSRLASIASRFALERDGVLQSVYDSEGGAWERWPMPAAGVLWRLSNGAMTDRNWVLSEVSLFSDELCMTRLSANFSVYASMNWSGTPNQVFDQRADSSWRSDCSRCPLGRAFVELEFNEPLLASSVSCVKVLQHGGSESVLLQRWDGAAWATEMALRGVGGGVGEPAQQRPVRAGAMWRVRALSLDGNDASHGWRVFELRMCSDHKCRLPASGYEAIASGEGSATTRAKFAVDENHMTWWAGGDNTAQWIGLWFAAAQEVQCFQIWQSLDRWATLLVLERWDGENWAGSNSLRYRPAGSGYFSTCDWYAEGTFWRLTHSHPLNGIWRIHEVELFLDDNCSKPVMSQSVIAASGQPTWNSQNPLTHAVDSRLETFSALCQRYEICAPRTQYIGIDFVEPQAVRCLRVWQSGAQGGLIFERRLGPGGEALRSAASNSQPTLQLRPVELGGSTDFSPTYNQTLATIPARNERWLWADSSTHGAADDCRNEQVVDMAGWCQKCGCITCPMGQEPLIAPQTHLCTLCSVGRFSDKPGSHRCQVCPPGRFGNATGQTACEDCPAGQYAAMEKLSQCQSCERGSYQSRPGQSECHLCRSGYASGERGQTICEECTWSMFSREGAIQCTFDGHFIFWAVTLVKAVTVVSFLILTALRYNMPIEDAFTEEGYTTIVACGHHWLLPPKKWWWRKSRKREIKRASTSRLENMPSEITGQETSIPVTSGTLHSVEPQMAHFLPRVYLVGTGIYWLKDTPQELRVSTTSRKRLLLHNLYGSRLDKPLECSIGSLQLPFSEVLLRTGLIVPLWVLLAVFLALAFAAPGLGGLPTYLWLGEACGSIFLGAAAYWYRQTRILKTSHQKRLKRYREILRRKNPSPKPCRKGPGRAVTAGQLWHLYEYFHHIIGDRDMYYVNENILKPLTKASQLSYAELAGPTELTWYVSHYWGTSFRHFVESIRKHAETVGGPKVWRKGSYWICSLGNNQWHVKEELGGNWDESAFFLALQSPSCLGTAMVIDEEALPLTRSWCLFEVLQTFLLERDVERFQGLVLCTNCGILNHGSSSVDTVLKLTHLLAGLQLENAQATMESDKKMIDDLVVSELGGFHDMNLFIKRKIQSALLAARNHFERQFEELAGQLAEPLRTPCADGTEEPVGQLAVPPRESFAEVAQASVDVVEASTDATDTTPSFNVGVLQPDGEVEQRLGGLPALLLLPNR